jgi:hypothetical protein
LLWRRQLGEGKLTASSQKEWRALFRLHLQGIGETHSQLLGGSALAGLDAANGHDRATNSWRELFARQVECLAPPPNPCSE